MLIEGAQLEQRLFGKPTTPKFRSLASYALKIFFLVLYTPLHSMFFPMTVFQFCTPIAAGEVPQNVRGSLLSIVALYPHENRSPFILGFFIPILDA